MPRGSAYTGGENNSRATHRVGTHAAIYPSYRALDLPDPSGSRQLDVARLVASPDVSSGIESLSGTLTTDWAASGLRVTLTVPLGSLAM